MSQLSFGLCRLNLSDIQQLKATVQKITMENIAVQEIKQSIQNQHYEEALKSLIVELEKKFSLLANLNEIIQCLLENWSRIAQQSQNLKMENQQYVQRIQKNELDIYELYEQREMLKKQISEMDIRVENLLIERDQLLVKNQNLYNQFLNSNREHRLQVGYLESELNRTQKIREAPADQVLQTQVRKLRTQIKSLRRESYQIKKSNQQLKHDLLQAVQSLKHFQSKISINTENQFSEMLQSKCQIKETQQRKILSLSNDLQELSSHHQEIVERHIDIIHIENDSQDEFTPDCIRTNKKFGVQQQNRDTIRAQAYINALIIKNLEKIRKTFQEYYKNDANIRNLESDPQICQLINNLRKTKLNSKNSIHTNSETPHTVYDHLQKKQGNPQALLQLRSPLKKREKQSQKQKGQKKKGKVNFFQQHPELAKASTMARIKSFGNLAVSNVQFNCSKKYRKYNPQLRGKYPNFQNVLLEKKSQSIKEPFRKKSAASAYCSVFYKTR